MSKQVEVKFMVDVEESVKEADVIEWVEFELGARGSMNRCNPIACDIDAYAVQIEIL